MRAMSTAVKEIADITDCAVNNNVEAHVFQVAEKIILLK